MIYHYRRRCVPCAINYDVIIKFETLEEDSKYLIEQCHLDDRLEVGHENPAPTGARTQQVRCHRPQLWLTHLLSFRGRRTSLKK